MTQTSERIDDIASREAQHGQKMIEIKVRFWTDGLIVPFPDRLTAPAFNCTRSDVSRNSPLA